MQTREIERVQIGQVKGKDITKMRKIELRPRVLTQLVNDILY